MSTVSRHTLKKANQSHRKRSPQLPTRKSRSPIRPAVRSMKRLWRRRRLWLGIIIVVVFIGLGSWYYGVRSSSLAQASAANSQHGGAQTTPASTTPNWQTVHTFTGSDTGSTTKKLDKFTVAGTWQISWVPATVNLSSFLVVLPVSEPVKVTKK